MKILNYNPVQIEADIAKLKKEIDEFNKETEKHNKPFEIAINIIDNIFSMVAVCFFLMFMLGVIYSFLIIIKPNIAFIDLFVEFMRKRDREYGVLLVILFVLCFALTKIEELIKEKFVVKLRSFKAEASKVMKFHETINGKKLLDVVDYGDFVKVVFENKDHTVSTETLLSFVAQRKVGIKEKEIDVEKGIVYEPYNNY